MKKKYQPKQIEIKWQKAWGKQKLYQVNARTKKKKFYALVEFPYPSGEGLHVGHTRSYTAMDVVARKRRAEGYEVLYPMGWDAFGLPTENYAIKTGLPPQLITKRNTTRYRKQLQSLGFSFDWSREINTTDPNYYQWTQWLFLQFFKKGLAYKAKVPINWCPKDKIGLANEEVIDGKCERCGTSVEQRDKEQWLLAITKYADRLDRELDLVDYSESVKIQQRNWIGRREGAEIEFKIFNPSPSPLPEGEGEFGYQTADPQTWQALQGKAKEMRQNSTKAEDLLWQLLRRDATNYHFRRQHIIGKVIVDFVCLEKKLIVEVDGDVHDYQKESDQERTNFLEQKGFKIIRFKNKKVIENGILIVAEINEALEALSFGEGLGGVDSIKIFTTRPETIFGATFIARHPPAGGVDRFTGEYAINPANQEKIPIWEAEYVMGDVGTGAIMGVPAHDERDLAFAQKHNLPIKEVPLAGQETLNKIGSKPFVTYKLRDWVFSRQRYWGEPIPLIFCPKCDKWQPVPDKDLPVRLPVIKNYQPTDTGESPLANLEGWVKVKCPACAGPARRETDVMPNWAGSSWYYFAYLMRKANSYQLSATSLKKWLPVDWYNGGMEHTTLHLLYSRFWHKVLNDLKLVPGKEPYQKRTSHGLILAQDGEKMSKSRGNVINPDEIVRRFGADTLRVYEMFMGPFGQAIAWNEDGLIGARRFLERVWRMVDKIRSTKHEARDSDKILNSKPQETIKKVSDDIEVMKFNTAISSLMILLNSLEKESTVSIATMKGFLKLLSPFAPHLTDELWRNLGGKKSIHLAPWPKELKTKNEKRKVKIVVQINGKTRDVFETEFGLDRERVQAAASDQPKVKLWLNGKPVQKTIFIPNRLINFVVDNK